MKKLIMATTVLMLVIGIQACQSKNVPICPVEALLIEEDSFLAGARAGELHSPLPDNSRYSAGRTFYLNRGIANHDVYPYSSVRRAEEEFQHNQQSPIFSDSFQEWELPEELSDFYPHADRFDVACGLQHQIPMCEMIAQYENYFIYFNIHTYPENGALSDVRALLQEIDDKMVGCLENQE